MNFSAELARFTADRLIAAVEGGDLSAEEFERAKDAMRAGLVFGRCRPDGTFTIQIGSVAAVEGHIFDLPSLAAEWEAVALG